MGGQGRGRGWSVIGREKQGMGLQGVGEVREETSGERRGKGRDFRGGAR